MRCAPLCCLHAECFTDAGELLLEDLALDRRQISQIDDGCVRYTLRPAHRLPQPGFGCRLARLELSSCCLGSYCHATEYTLGDAVRNP